MSAGNVEIWNSEEGWGVIDSPDTPGGCWTHFSHLWSDDRPTPKPVESLTISGGFRELVVGEPVDFTWEHVTDQNGYVFRAITVRPNREPPPRKIVQR